MNDHSRRVVLLIDYDNLQICASRDTPGRDLQLTPVVQLAQHYGTVILARAYAEWNLSTERLAVYKAGIEPAFAPVLRTESDRSGKSLADTVMVAEGMDMLWTLSPDVVVLATSDKDLIPLVRVAKQRGAFVVVLGSDFTAIPLREMADEHFTYRQLITDASGRFATEAGPGRQPAALPEPTRRRSRDRVTRERTATTAAATPTASTGRSERAERGERERAERVEGRERASREATPAAPASAPEPVAPVTAGAPGEADMQTSGRRRRRRGSRRRADRLGATSAEGTTSGEDASADIDPEAAISETADPEPSLDVSAITPTTSAIDVAQASDATVEEPGTRAVADESQQAAATPAPRDRRRRTRRVTAGAEAPAGTAEAPAAGSAAASSVEGVPVSPVAPSDQPVPAQSADVLPAPPPDNGSTDAPAAADASEETAAPARRPRRVASASRGRSRRP